jgi:hypothetical protein
MLVIGAGVIFELVNRWACGRGCCSVTTDFHGTRDLGIEENAVRVLQEASEASRAVVKV